MKANRKLARNSASAILSGVLGLVLYFNLFCHSKSGPEQSPYLNHNDTVKYIGMNACRTCHEHIYQTFIQTGMGQSFGPATRKKSSAIFRQHHLVYDTLKDFYYMPLLHRDSIFILEFRLAGKDTVHKRIQKADYIIGSGQHTNSHLFSVNGYLYQLPLTWYSQQGRWDLPPGFDKGNNTRFGRSIAFECMSCHNAMPGMDDVNSNRFTRVPDGIDCERCHGPGEAHVKLKMAGQFVDTATQIDYSIVNPRKLSRELQTDVCQRCHLQGNSVLKKGKNFSDFRPGMKLSDFWDTYMPVYEGADDEFIMASHAQRLQMSKCFVRTARRGGEETGKAWQNQPLTCISCHNPHVSVKQTGVQVFNSVCSGCHTGTGIKTCNEATVKAHLSSHESENKANCVSCHMPRNGTVDIPHVTVHDHFIRIPAVSLTVNRNKRFAGLYCVNNPATDALSRIQAFLNYYEKFEAGTIALDTAAFYLSVSQKSTDWLETQVHYLYLKNDFAGIAAATSFVQAQTLTDAWLAYRIGQSHQNLGDIQKAEVFFRKACSLSPDNLDFADKLGSVLVIQAKTEEGISVLESCLQKNPLQESVLTNLGFACLQTGNTQKAENCYKQALQLNPDFEQALFNLAALCNLKGDKASAKKYLSRILSVNPSNKDVAELIKQLQ